ncbi:hypothetical protein Tco_1385455 [Tanacetum coccineum]
METEVESMVTVPIQQVSSSVPLLILQSSISHLLNQYLLPVKNHSLQLLPPTSALQQSSLVLKIDRNDQRKVMRLNSFHKFSDGTRQKHPSETMVVYMKVENPAKSQHQTKHSYERPHKGVKASANSDVMYFFTSAQDSDPSQDDVRLCLGDDLKKAQDHSQRQAEYGIKNVILHTENSFLSNLFIVSEKDSIRRIQQGRYDLSSWIRRMWTAWIRCIGNWSNAFSCEVLAQIRHISVVGNGVLVKFQQSSNIFVLAPITNQNVPVSQAENSLFPLELGTRTDIVTKKKVIKESSRKLWDVRSKCLLNCDTTTSKFINNEVNRLSRIDDDLFTYEVEVVNIQCDSRMDDDSKHEADDDMGYDPSDVAFTEWLGSKFFNYKMMDHYTKKALWIYWIRGDDKVELTDEESFDDKDEVVEDYEWYKALEDSELKDEALRNKAIMEGFIKEDDDESCYEQMRRWNINANYNDAYETNHEDNKSDELCEVHELPMCNIRRYMIINIRSIMMKRPRKRNIDEYWWRIYKSGDLEVLES